MFFRLIFLIAFITWNSTYSQEAQKLKDLEIQLNSSKDVDEQLNILESLWKITAYDDANKAIEYANASISIAKQHKQDSKLARAYERLGIAFANISEYGKSNNVYLKAIELHKEQNKPRFMSSLLMNQAINFKDNSQFDSALHYMDKSETYMNRENYCCKDDTLLEINLNSIKSQIYIEQGKYLLSLDRAIEATRLSKMINDSIQYADNLALVGDNNQVLGNYTMAIDYLKESLSIYKTSQDSYYECLTAKSISELYAGLKPIE
ncbi:hypothetical protein [Winogradskyella sp.]|uniref:hypothetical protein n=1 Tax=Winogradskyella sp. TaxID=1883156 RepID=UPI003F6D544A